MWRKEHPDKCREYANKQRKSDKYRENQARWKKEHPDKCREYAKKQRKEHPDKRREYAKNWLRKNREKKNKSTREWARRNPKKIAERGKRYRKEHPQKIAQQKLKTRELNVELRSTATMHYKKWDPQDELWILEMTNVLSRKQLAEATGRTLYSIEARLKKLMHSESKL